MRRPPTFSSDLVQTFNAIAPRPLGHPVSLRPATLQPPVLQVRFRVFEST
jgi:hypothetical protein